MGIFWIFNIVKNIITTKKDQTIFFDVPERFEQQQQYYGIHKVDENSPEQRLELPSHAFISELIETKKYKEGKPAVIVTGATGGLGIEIAKAAAKEGKYTVIMACRNMKKAETIREQIIKETNYKDIEIMELDLSSIKSVISFTDNLLKRGVRIERLMNNAGTMEHDRIITEDGFEETCQTNYICPLLLTLKLLPLIPKGSRIVNMLSLTYRWASLDNEFFTKGMKGTFHRIPVYCNTKQAFLFATLRLAEELKSSGISVAGSDPGIASTGIIHMDMWFDPIADLIARPLMSTPSQGASPAIKLLFDEEPKTGCLLAQSGEKDIGEYRTISLKDCVFEQTIDILKKFF